MNAAQSKLKNVLWLRGDLSWKLHAAQHTLDRIFNKIKGTLFVGNCSRQWGKSYWAVTKAIEQAIRVPKSQIRYGAAFQSDLVDFIIPAFDKIFEDAPKNVRGVLKKVGSSYVFPNGSRIKLVGLDKNPNGLRGNTLDLIIIDECGFVGNLDYIYKSVIIPATLHRPNCRVILISTPPSTPAHPFVDYIQKAELQNAYVKLDIHTNPLITVDDIQRMADEMGGKNSTTFRREALCELVTDSDLAIIPEWQDKYVQALERDQYYQYYHKYEGMDLGIKDNTALIFGYFDFKRAALVVEDELKMNGSALNSLILVEAIRVKEKDLWSSDKDTRDYNENPVPYRRVSDTTWPILIADLSSLHSLPFIETSKDSLEAMINEVRLMVQAGQIIVHPRCTQLIGCLKYGVWDNKKKAFARSSVYGHFDHLAALVYLVRNLAKHTNPIPLDHGAQNHTHWLGGVNSKIGQSHNASTIAKTFIARPQQIDTSRRKRKF